MGRIRRMPRLGKTRVRLISVHRAIALYVFAWCLSGLHAHPVLLRLDEPEQDELATDSEPIKASPASNPSERTRPVFEVKTFAGTSSVRGHVVAGSELVIAFVLADSLLDEDWGRVESELIAVRKGLGSQGFLKLAVAEGAGLRLNGPFRRADDLRSALRAARPEDPESSHGIEKPSDPLTELEASSEGVDRPEARRVTDGPAEGAEESLHEALLDSEAAEIAEARLYQQIGVAAAVLGCEWQSVLVVGRLPVLDALTGPVRIYVC